jgi:hypothetical protein
MGKWIVLLVPTVSVGTDPWFHTLLVTTQSIVTRENRPVKYNREIQAALEVVMKESASTK